MRNSVLGFIAVAFLLFIFAGEAFACKCALRKASERFAEADKVFSGEVIKTTPLGEEDITAVFNVEAAWKGLENDKVIITTGTDSAACGLEFKVGEKYILWVDGNSTGSCDNEVDDEKEFLRDKPKLTLKKITLKDEEPAQDSSQNEPVANSNTSNQSIDGAEKDESIFSSTWFIFAVIAFVIIDFLIIGLIIFQKVIRR